MADVCCTRERYDSRHLCILPEKAKKQQLWKDIYSNIMLSIKISDKNMKPNENICMLKYF